MEDPAVLRLWRACGIDDQIARHRGEEVGEPPDTLTPDQRAAYETGKKIAANLLAGYEESLSLIVELEELRRPSAPKPLVTGPCGWFSAEAAQSLYLAEPSAWIPVHEYITGPQITTHITPDEKPPAEWGDIKFLGHISRLHVSMIPTRWYAPR